MSEYRVYVACLASYNAGTLHGEWIDCDDVSTMQDDINAMLRASPFPNVTVECTDCVGRGERVIGHNSETGATRMGTCDTCNGTGRVPSAEEYAIHDYDGFPSAITQSLGEYPSLDSVVLHARMLDEHGLGWGAYVGHVGADYATEEGFQDCYHGEWDSERAYAEDYVDSCGLVPDDSLAARYFDYDAFARDLFMDGYTFVDGYVFSDR